MLTSKSMMFNGRYIEDLIDGYTTIDVTGRELAEVAVDSFEVGNRDGAILRNIKYSPRTLKIDFIIEGDDIGFNPDNTTLIQKLNELNGILDLEDEVPIIFRDEPDKFYMGIRSGSPTATMALGVVKGSFNIYCADPFKYSVDEVIATPSLTGDNGFQTFMIDYQGTHRAYPTYQAQFYTQNTAPRVADIQESTVTQEELEDPEEVTSLMDESSTGNEDEQIAGKGACGYVAFFDDQEHILQFGNPNETGEPAPELIPKTLVSQSFQTLGTWTQSVQSNWYENSGSVPAGFNQYSSFKIGASYNNTQSMSTSNTMLSNSAGTNVNYTVKCVCDNRSASGVRFTVTVTSSKFTAAVPYNASLVGYMVYGDDVLGRVTLKKAAKSKSGAWKKGKTVSASFKFTLSGIEPLTDIISGLRFGVERSGGSGSVGRLGYKTCANCNIPVYITPVVNSYYLTPNVDMPSSTTKGQFYGPTIYRNIPADASGNVGWTDFEADFHLKYCSGYGANDTNQCGAVYVGVVTGDYNNGVLTNPKILAGVTLKKTQNGNTGYISTIGNGVYQTRDSKFDTSYYNLLFGSNRGAYTTTTTQTIKVGKKTTTKKVTTKHAATNTNKHIVITKSGTTVTFKVGGKTFTWDGAEANAKAYRIILGAFTYAGMPRLDWVGFYGVRFTPTKIGQLETTIPFTTGDFLSAESATGDVYLNDVLRPELGALGNDWERMYLTPGINYIGTSFSDWSVEYAYRRCNEDDFFDEHETYYVKSGDDYIITTVTEAVFNETQSNYYVKESTAPQFTIRYREVFA